jgi:heme exporter protein A
VSSSPAVPDRAWTSVATEDPQQQSVAVGAASLDVRIGRTRILSNLDLTVRGGEVVAITGPNGSGKSTLLRVLASLRRPSAGRLEILGHAGPQQASAEVRRQIVLVGHDPALHPDLTLAENLQLVAELAGRPPSSARDALTDVGLVAAADRPARVCSEGMRRRLGLARALLCRPRLLLLDEPQASLDVDARPLVATVAAQVTARGGAVVLVTHDVDGTPGAIDRVLTLRGGRLVGEAGT